LSQKRVFIQWKNGIVLTGCRKKVHVLAITAEDEKTMFTGKKVAIIGGGKMGGILARGMIT
ncbi:MAG TPA: hypothetical protein DHO02_05160, partial [Syntrophaceae bacterium]|nr:hypothetical protein [Syntrophaceae bacterium]